MSGLFGIIDFLFLYSVILDCLNRLATRWVAVVRRLKSSAVVDVQISWVFLRLLTTFRPFLLFSLSWIEQFTVFFQPRRITRCEQTLHEHLSGPEVLKSAEEYNATVKL